MSFNGETVLHVIESKNIVQHQLVLIHSLILHVVHWGHQVGGDRSRVGACIAGVQSDLVNIRSAAGDQVGCHRGSLRQNICRADSSEVPSIAHNVTIGMSEGNIHVIN